MFETSADILNAILAAAIVLAALALAWLLIEAAYCVHQANAVVREVRKKVRRIEESLAAIGEKLEHSVGYLAVLAESAKAILGSAFGKSRRRGKRS